MAPHALCQIPLGGIEFKGVAPKVIALVASRLPQLPIVFCRKTNYYPRWKNCVAMQKRSRFTCGVVPHACSWFVSNSEYRLGLERDRLGSVFRLVTC